MDGIAIECTMCDQRFQSNKEYDEHQCTPEEEIGLLPIKEEPMQITQIDCEVPVKEEPLDEVEEGATIEIDPLALLDEDQDQPSDDGSNSMDSKTKTENLSEEESSVAEKCVNKYNCKVCGDSFLKKLEFTKHFRTEHSSYRPYECKVCFFIYIIV